MAGNNDMMLDNSLIKELKVMKEKGVSVVDILKKIKNFHSDEPQIKLLCMKYFRESYGLSMSDVAPISGWCGLGGELTNEQITNLLLPCFIKRDERGHS